MTPLLLIVLMVLAAYRITRLVTVDTFPPVLWVRDRIAGGWRPMTPGELVRAGTAALALGTVMEIDGKQCRYVRRMPWSPQWLADLASCTWCASGWVSGAVTAVTAVTVGVPVPYLTGFAVWAGAALLAAHL
jgi:hypothetical protein